MLSSELAPGAIVACALPPEDPTVEAWRARGVKVLSLPDDAGRVDLTALVGALGAMSPAPLTSILCEGGGVLAASLLSAELVDEVALFVAPKVFGADGVPAVGPLAGPLAGLSLESLERVGDDALLVYHKER
jgi:diaminohydroxyphosphoribosylaminopyrimidine deaminase/5-amino-6-(5-phosphoribosylamino)uracil reductase